MVFIKITFILSVVITLCYSQNEPFNSNNKPQVAESWVCDRDGFDAILNKKVIWAERWSRPLGHLSRTHIASVLGFTHHAIVATTEDGYRYLVQKGENYGEASETVVSCSSDFDGGNWNELKRKSVSGNHNLYDYVIAGGKSYNLVTDNCQHGATRMYDLD